VRRALLALSVLVSLAFAGPAAAAEVVLQDAEGRAITFDVRSEGVDAEWYAAVLRAAPHGDEISSVRVVVASWEELRDTCGKDAGGCYARNVMVVPAEQSEVTAHVVVHEYGHHLDRSRPVAGVPEPNGTSEWWRARGMAELVRVGSVRRNYEVDWDRSIAEIFAEDYARLAGSTGPYRIQWLGPPSETVLQALRADFGLGPPPAVVERPALKPVTFDRSGRLAPKRAWTERFGLLGPGRRVTARATFTGAAEKKVRAALELRCNGVRVVRRTLAAGKTTVAIDRRNLGPADRCTVSLTSSSSTTRAFTLRVVLSIPGVDV
jgi:hypothetical protein